MCRDWAGTHDHAAPLLSSTSSGSAHLHRVAACQRQQGCSFAGGLHEAAEALADAVGRQDLGTLTLLQDEEAHEQLEVCGHGPCSQAVSQP